MLVTKFIYKRYDNHKVHTKCNIDNLRHEIFKRNYILNQLEMINPKGKKSLENEPTFQDKQPSKESLG